MPDPIPPDASTAEVVVVGAGPAGMRAALAAADAGCVVDLLDSAPLLGGQYHRQSLLAHPVGPARLFADVDGHPRIRWHPGTTVWAAEPGPVLYIRRDDGPAAVLHGRAVVLATGGYDRALPFPGWDRPGVLTAGGMQALLKGQGLLAGRRVALSGTGPFLLPVAAAMAEAGAEVVGVFEAGHPGRWSRHLPTVSAAPGKLREGWDYLRVLRRHRIPLRFRHAIVRAHGEHEVTGATVAQLRPDWTVVPGSTQHLDVDAIGVGYGFVPVLDLALSLSAEATPDGVPVDQWQRTTAPGVLAAGETTGIGGAALAAAEGHLAGLAAAVHCGHLDGPTAARLGRDAWRQRIRHRRFADALRSVYPVRSGWRTWLDPDTLVCRCEEVPLAAVRHALGELAVTDLRTLKLVCRAGMGVCQGRVCGPAVADLLRAHTGRPVPDPLRFANRPLATPVPLGVLAGLDPPANP
jgi:NADPH-dependent 2,4-dienoyl-CoA reductase/sulfur reductase-like enzyme